MTEGCSRTPSMLSSSCVKIYGWRAGTSKLTTCERTTAYVLCTCGSAPSLTRAFRVSMCFKTMHSAPLRVYRAGVVVQMRQEKRD